MGIGNGIATRDAPLAAAQARRFGNIEPSCGVDRNAVVAAGLLGADQAVKHIVAHPVWIARPRIAETATAWKMQAHGIARRHGLPALRPDRPPRAQRDSAGSACAAAVPSARRVFDPLEIAQQSNRIGVGAADFDDLAKPAAEFSGPA